MRQACRATVRLLVVASGWVGCASSTPAPAAPGASDAPRPAGAPLPADGPAPARWPRFDEAAAWEPLVVPPYPCEGHAPPRYVASPRVAPEHRGLYESLVAGAMVPNGFTVTLWHRERDSDTPGPVYAMAKGPDGAWRFSVMDRSGDLEPGTRVALCARCHAEAPADHLFGLPRRLEGPPAAGSPAQGPRPTPERAASPLPSE